LEEVARRIRAAGGEASVTTGDLITEAGMESAVAHAEKTYGKLDILFNNLGDFVIPEIPLERTSDEQWTYLTNINLKTAYLCTRFAVPAFRRAGAGVIIHLAASYDIRMSAHPGYTAGKMGMIGLTQRTALVYRPDNIRVICLCPNAMGNSFAGERVALPNAKLQRGGSPEDLAWAALFFASDEAAWLTGVTIPIDGGNSLVAMSHG
jgi:NAD(P)-dependent dehydrogenase (short-subunit alcohol dehydrogenase family)